MTRAITTQERDKFRLHNQSARLFLTWPTYHTVFTGILASVPTSLDDQSQISYSSGSGYTNVLPEFTLLVGSTAGAYDLGRARIRKAPTSSILYIGEESEVNWQSGAYLTVTDDVSIWPRHITVNPDQTVVMDSDITYSDQNTVFDPIPIMGPDVVLWLGWNGQVTYAPPNGADSWVINSSISTYAWTITSGGSVSGGSTATPTFTMTAAGTYRIQLTVTAANGKSYVGHRYIVVHDANHLPSVEFALGTCRGNKQSGGWSMDITIWDPAILSTIADQKYLILFSTDYYGTEKTSIGQVTGAEQTIMSGWVSDYTIDWLPEGQPNEAQVHVDGAAGWLDKITAFPAGVRDKTATANKWTRMNNLSPKKGYWHFMHWRSNVTARCDVYSCDYNTPMPAFESPGGQTLWQQIQTILSKSIFVNPRANRYNQFFAKIEQNLVPVANRGTIPVVGTVAPVDCYDRIKIQVQRTPQVSYLDLSGASWSHATMLATPIFTLSPGHIFKRWGKPASKDRYLFGSQSDADNLSGLWVGWQNNKYPNIRIPLASNNRMYDIADYQYLTLDTSKLSMVTESSIRTIPIDVSFKMDGKTGALYCDIVAEAETFPDLSHVGDQPVVPPTITPTPTPVPTPIPTPLPIPTGNLNGMFIADGTDVWWSGDVHNGGAATWNRITNLPSGTLCNMIVELDGSALYVAMGGHLTSYIYKAVPPYGTAPTWNAIWSPSDSGGGYQQEWCVGGGAPNGLMSRNPGGHGISIEANAVSYPDGFHSWFNGVYTGSWAWTHMSQWAYGGGFNHRYGWQMYAINPQPAGGVTAYALPSDTVIGSYSAPEYVYSHSNPWKRADGSIRQLIRYYPPLDQNIHIANPATNYGLGGLYPDSQMGDKLTGAYNGSRLLYTDSSGYLHLSDSDANFSRPFQWLDGWIYCGGLTGGTDLLWVPQSVSASNEMIRVSYDNGNTWTNITGNFWSTTSGGKTFVAVYPTYG